MSIIQIYFIILNYCMIALHVYLIIDLITYISIVYNICSSKQFYDELSYIYISLCIFLGECSRSRITGTLDGLIQILYTLPNSL